MLSQRIDRQAGILRHWIDLVGIERPALKLAVLDTQIRPHLAQEVLDEARVANSQIVLVDCEPEIRNDRLINERKQPDLANPQMDCWAAYLRGQADALRLSIIETGKASLDESFLVLREIVGELLSRERDTL